MYYIKISGMNLSHKILFISLLLAATQAAVVVNRLALSDQNVAYSGLIPVTETNNLFFTYYGVDNQNEGSLKNYPLLIVVGR